jgi:glycine/D-amino acid oxidase-like deaminating enzyme
MLSSYHIVVVGGGIAGLAIAGKLPRFDLATDGRE